MSFQVQSFKAFKQKWWRRWESNPRPKTLHKSVYRLRSGIILGAKGAPDLALLHRAFLSFNRYAGRRTYLACLIRSSLSLAYQASAVRALADLCSQGVIVVVGNYYFAACFTRPRGTSACSPCFIASVEAVAPPWSVKLISKNSFVWPLKTTTYTIISLDGLARGE